MRFIKSNLKSIILLALFLVSYLTRSQEIPVEEGPGSFERGSGDLLAGALLMLLLPAYIISLLAYLYALKDDVSRWTVRWARHLAYVPVLSTNALAIHLGKWNAIFNPVSILLNPSESFNMRLLSAVLAVFFLFVSVLGLRAFIRSGSHRTLAEVSKAQG